MRNRADQVGGVTPGQHPRATFRAAQGDLVRVFYNDGNFERKARAVQLADERGISMFEVCLAYATSRSFPVVALAGPETVEEVISSASAGNVQLTGAECAWLDLSSDERPF